MVRMTKKFARYVGLGNLDTESKKTLVWDPRTEKLFVATAIKEYAMPNFLLSGSFTTLFYVFLRRLDKTTSISGVAPLLIGWIIAFLLGLFFIRCFMAIKVNVEPFRESSINLGEFLVLQKQLLMKFWRTIFLILSLAFFFGILYLFMNALALLVASSLLIVVIPMIYFSAIHKRKPIIERLMRDKSLNDY